MSNATSLRFVLVEPALDEVDVEEREVECLPFSNQVLCQNEVPVYVAAGLLLFIYLFNYYYYYYYYYYYHKVQVPLS